MNKQLPMTASAEIDEDRQRAPRFQDWSNFISFQPRLYFRPQALAELKGFVALAAQGFIQPGTRAAALPPCRRHRARAMARCPQAAGRAPRDA